MFKARVTYKVILQNGALVVPRSEFYSAIKHFAPPLSRIPLERAYRRKEQEGYKELHLAISYIGLQEYSLAMYKQGRGISTSKSDRVKDFLFSLLHAKSPRALVLNPEKDYQND